MSLVIFYNTLCPRINHEHRRNNNPINFEKCILCVNTKERELFVKYCDNYFNLLPQFTQPSEYITRNIFSQGPEHLRLPVELQDMIFKLCWQKKKYNKPIFFDENGLFHMTNCIYCVSFIVNFINNNSCNNHNIPRIGVEQINYLVP
jgi:hypothetical protein